MSWPKAADVLCNPNLGQAARASAKASDGDVCRASAFGCESVIDHLELRHPTDTLGPFGSSQNECAKRFACHSGRVHNLLNLLASSCFSRFTGPVLRVSERALSCGWTCQTSRRFPSVLFRMPSGFRTNYCFADEPPLMQNFGKASQLVAT